jgi:calcineurin-like phosphoesterase family protein
MARAIVEAWRRVLTEKDVLYVLGDLGGSPTGTEHVRTLLAECPAPVRWVRGNHDRDSWPDALEPLATYLGDRVELKIDRSDNRDDHPVFLVLDHYPMARWNRFYHGAVQLHGHEHGGLDNEGIQRFDVGIDSVGAEPVSEMEIVDRALAIEPPKYADG